MTDEQNWHLFQLILFLADKNVPAVIVVNYLIITSVERIRSQRTLLQISFVGVVIEAEA